MPTVYTAACLRHRHPDVHLALSKALDAAGIPLVEVPGTGNIWIRDWMPIRCGGNFVKFRGHTMDTEHWPQLAIPGFGPSNTYCGVWPTIHSDIILDGGNVVRSPDGTRVLMTDQVLLDNPSLALSSGLNLSNMLEDLLEAKIILLPVENGDTLGHSDGLAHWIDNDTVFVNDRRSMRDIGEKTYDMALRKILRENKIEAVPFPWAYDLCRDVTEERFRQEFPDADDQNPCVGYFINMLVLPELIIYPKYNIPKDREAEDAIIDAFPGVPFVGIDCSRLSYEGGAIHCVTWTGD